MANKETTPEQDSQIERMVDKRGISYALARTIFLGSIDNNDEQNLEKHDFYPLSSEELHLGENIENIINGYKNNNTHATWIRHGYEQVNGAHLAAINRFTQLQTIPPEDVLSVPLTRRMIEDFIGSKIRIEMSNSGVERFTKKHNDYILARIRQELEQLSYDQEAMERQLTEAIEGYHESALFWKHYKEFLADKYPFLKSRE